MKRHNKQLSSIALLSLLVLTGCGNNNVAKNDVVPPVTPAGQDIPAPTEQVVTPTIISTGASSDTVMVDSGKVSENGNIVGDAGGPIIESITPTPDASDDIVKSGSVSYKSPAWEETIKVSVALKNGVITKATATPEATNPISLKLQTGFSEKVSEKVVGKAINGLKVDTISGASLTTAAFNEFLAKNTN